MSIEHMKEMTVGLIILSFIMTSCVSTSIAENNSSGVWYDAAYDYVVAENPLETELENLVKNCTYSRKMKPSKTVIIDTARIERVFKYETQRSSMDEVMKQLFGNFLDE